VIHRCKRHLLSEPPATCELPLSSGQRLLLMVAIHIACLLVAAAERLPPRGHARSGGL
jgi:hypothetical protein